MKTSILLFLFFIITPTLIPASAETFNLRMEDHELLNKGELILRKNKIEGNFKTDPSTAEIIKNVTDTHRPFWKCFRNV